MFEVQGVLFWVDSKITPKAIANAIKEQYPSHWSEEWYGFLCQRIHAFLRVLEGIVSPCELVKVTFFGLGWGAGHCTIALSVEEAGKDCIETTMILPK